MTKIKIINFLLKDLEGVIIKESTDVLDIRCFLTRFKGDCKMFGIKEDGTEIALNNPAPFDIEEYILIDNNGDMTSSSKDYIALEIEMNQLYRENPNSSYSIHANTKDGLVINIY